MSGRKGSKFSKAGFRNSVFGTAAVTKSGDLKKATKGMFGTRFQKRYFLVNAHYLKYYENQEASKDLTDSKVKGTIDLAKCKDIEAKGDEIHITVAEGDIQVLKATSAASRLL